MSVTDFINLTSALRLGSSLGIIKDVNIMDLNKWLFQVLPGHITINNEDVSDEKEENILRAKIIRNYLGG